MRRFYIHTVLFALGILGAQLSPVLPPTWLSAAALLGLLPCFVFPAARPAALLCIGALWALLRADLILSQEWPASLESRDVILAGTVSGLPLRDERYLKFDLDVEQARYRARPVAFTGRVRLRWYDPPPRAAAGLKAGTRWRLHARLKQPHGYYNPGGFDYEAYLYREGVRATGYVREADGNRRTGKDPERFLSVWRQALRDRLEASLTGLRHPGLLRALALGDRSGIADNEWDTLRATGTSHLIAISGLHVGFVAGVGGLLGMGAGRIASMVAGTVSAPQVAAVSALCCAFLYAALSGFDVPAQRAFVMVAVFLLGILCRRHAWTLRGLCVALLGVLVLHPASVHDPGFWMSFCAVGLILGWLSRGTSPAPSDTRSRLLEAAKLQGMLSLALLPLVIAFFSMGSLVAAPANLLAVPVVMFTVVPACLASVVLVACGFGAGAAACLAAADQMMGWLWIGLAWLGGLEYARIEMHIGLWQCLVLLGGVLWLIRAATGRRWWGLAAGLVLLIPSAPAPEHGAFRVTVLDVGQGLAVVVRTQRRVLVYDTGPRYPGGFSLAEVVVVPYLRSRGVRDVDMLVVSHGDNDHRGGFEDLRASLTVHGVLSSVAGELPGARYCVHGQRWEWDGVTFEMLHPGRPDAPAHNNASCVLRVASRHGAMLLTGDIESEAEQALLRRDAVLRSDILLVPHQGSASSSTPSFIDRVAPRWAIVSAGYLNRYGHPRPDVLARYQRRSVAVMNTAQAGAVIVDVSRNGIEVRGWRAQRPRYWLDGGGPEPAKTDAIRTAGR